MAKVAFPPTLEVAFFRYGQNYVKFDIRNKVPPS